MSNKTIQVNDQLYDYILAVSLREPDILRRLREETAGMSMAQMQIAPEQGQFMAMLAQLMGARKTLEIGVFTGYSALSVALTLPDDGKIIACDVSEEWTAVARRYWREAGVAQKINLRLAPALQTLEMLVDTEGEGSFDFAFIDADKENYQAYYELCLRLLRRGGLVAVDNVLWSGSVIDKKDQDRDTKAIRTFNKMLHNDMRVTISLVPIADGLTLARKL